MTDARDVEACGPADRSAVEYLPAAIAAFPLNLVLVVLTMHRRRDMVRAASTRHQARVNYQQPRRPNAL
jgi:hypothetical protein